MRRVTRERTREINLPLLISASVGLIWCDLWFAIWLLQNERTDGDTALLAATAFGITVFLGFQLLLVRTRHGSKIFGGIKATVLFVVGVIFVSVLDGAMFHPGLIKDAVGDPLLMAGEFLVRLLILGVPGAVVAVFASLAIQALSRHSFC